MADRFEEIACTHDGTRLVGRLVRPVGAPSAASSAGPAVLLFHGGGGPGPSFYAAVEAMADQGYLAIGVDMFGIDADTSDVQVAGTYFAALMADPAHLRSRVNAWFDAACALNEVDAGRVAAVGYCFGGKCVLELARSGASLAAAVSFHGLLGTDQPARPGVVTAPVAIWTGGRDPYVPREDVDALQREFDGAGVDYQLTLFAQAQHSFMDPDHDGYAQGIAYDERSYRIAWAATLAFLANVLNPEPSETVTERQRETTIPF